MNRNLSPNIAKGMYGGPREIKGKDYLRNGNVSGKYATPAKQRVNGKDYEAELQRRLLNGA